MPNNTVASSVTRTLALPPAQPQPTVEVQPSRGGNMRVHLDSHETFLESRQPVHQGRTTLHVDASNGLRTPEVRGSDALRVVRQHTKQIPARVPDAPLLTVEKGAAVQASGRNGAESTVVVDAGEDTVAVISGRVPVDGSIVVRLMPTGESDGDEMVYMAQRYVTLQNKGKTTLENVSVDLMTPHGSVIDSLGGGGGGGGGPAALMAMLGGSKPTTPKTYVKYASLAKAITLAPGTLKLPLGEPVEMRLMADVSAEIADVKPRRKQSKPLTRSINAFANLGIRSAPEGLPPARYEILDRSGNLLTSTTQDAIAAKQNALLGRIPFGMVTGGCEVGVDVTDEAKHKAKLTLTTTMNNAEATERALDVVFDLWHVVGVDDMKVSVDGKPVDKPKVKYDPSADLLFVPVRIPAAGRDGTPGRVELKVVLDAKIETAGEALRARMGAQNGPAPDSMYSLNTNHDEIPEDRELRYTHTMRKATVVVLLLVGCALTTNSPEPTKPTTQPCADSGDLGALGKLLRDFGRALDRKDFADAEALLERAEHCAANANERMRGHPEFEDIDESVGRARPRLERTIEQDRIARINAAIDAIVERAQRAAGRAKVIVAELDSRMPTQEDIDYILEILGELEALAAEAETQGVVGEQRYDEHRAAQDRLVAALDERRRQAAWQRDLANALSVVVSNLVTAVTEAKTATSRDGRAAVVDKARSASQQCLAQIREVEGNPTFDATRLVQTQLGTLSVAATKQKCLAASAARTKPRKSGADAANADSAATAKPAKRRKRKKRRRRKRRAR